MIYYWSISDANGRKHFSVEMSQETLTLLLKAANAGLRSAQGFVDEGVRDSALEAVGAVAAVVEQTKSPAATAADEEDARIIRKFNDDEDA